MKNYLKPLGLSLAAIVAFLLLWSGVSKLLYNKAVDSTIEKIRTTQSEKAAIETKKRIESGDPSSQPNSLPSPSYVLETAKLLIEDSGKVMKDKREFKKKMADTNKELIKAGEEPIYYTGLSLIHI